MQHSKGRGSTPPPAADPADLRREAPAPPADPEGEDEGFDIVFESELPEN